MFNSSPITTWENAGAFFNWAGTSGPVLWLWVTIVLCLVPLYMSWRAENKAEREHG